ncbi:MAG: metal-dependent hydrolase, partial [Blastocatellia bacterium]|nr:metal-dependent hydrolase [Blastocatellia bacterium]
ISQPITVKLRRMDTITHGALGAAVAQSALSRRLPRGAGLIGAVGGMAADLDIFIYSLNDPTVSWTFHRNFTHSLIFIPLGGLIVALPFLLMKRFKDHKREVALAAIIGYATHGLLDAFTSYGTQLLWPFTNLRVAWDWVPIVDLIYTIPLWAGVIWTARTGNPKAVRAAFLLSSLYICFGGWQHHRALESQKTLASMRGHQVEFSRVMPAPGWLLFWRSLYVSNGRLYADGVETRWFGSTLALEGGSANLTTFDDLPENVRSNAESRRRFYILNWFADRLIAPVATAGAGENAFGDMRFTVAVESLTPLWGLQFDPASGDSRRWSPLSNQGREIGRMLKALVFGDARYKPLAELRASNAR